MRLVRHARGPCPVAFSKAFDAIAGLLAFLGYLFRLLLMRYVTAPYAAGHGRQAMPSTSGRLGQGSRPHLYATERSRWPGGRWCRVRPALPARAPGLLLPGRGWGRGPWSRSGSQISRFLAHHWACS